MAFEALQTNFIMFHSITQMISTNQSCLKMELWLACLPVQQKVSGLSGFELSASWRNFRKFGIKQKYHQSLTKAFQWKSMGISDFKWCSLHCWPFKSNFCNKNCILVLWSKWRGHFSSFQFGSWLEMTKTSTWSKISE